MEADYEGVIHGGLDSDKPGGDGRSKEKLEPRSVDAYWLQRELNKFFKDPIVSASPPPSLLIPLSLLSACPFVPPSICLSLIVTLYMHLFIHLSASFVSVAQCLLPNSSLFCL